MFTSYTNNRINNFYKTSGQSRAKNKKINSAVSFMNVYDRRSCNGQRGLIPTYSVMSSVFEESSYFNKRTIRLGRFSKVTFKHRIFRRMDSRLKTYKGYRRNRWLPVRGQSAHTNGMTVFRQSPYYRSRFSLIKKKFRNKPNVYRSRNRKDRRFFSKTKTLRVKKFFACLRCLNR